MPKLKIDDLKNIVMEGGGARGAAYLGAIRALEIKMSERSDVQAYSDLGKRKAGLLDYSNTTDNTLAIKGIAGSSAGAITTFALALGFNSDEIEKILDYDFTNFLSEKDAGKYRMVDKEGKLAVGEDIKNKVTKEKELAKKDDFKFRFDSNKTPVGGNIVKQGFRNLTFSVGIKTVVDGLTSNAKQLSDLVLRMLKITDENNLPPFWRGLFRWVYRPNNNFLQKLGWNKLAHLIFFKILIPTRVIKAPMQFDIDNFTNVFFDRGMFSGFAVREFFMDILILAVTNETLFHRGFLKYIEKKHNIPQVELNKVKDELLSVADFEIGERSKSKLSSLTYAEKYFHDLSEIIFSEFNEITEVHFAICVSNFTTGFPVYFSHEFTPDFRVMEAVAASMSIPPAIKPLYNESDVIKKQSDDGRVPFIKPNGSFLLSDYHFYEHLVKIALAQEMGKKGVSIDVNNTIDLSAFLIPLKKLVVGEINEFTQELIPAKKESINLNQPINGTTYTINYATLKFFYNTAYKGMFFDGGYRNNIPYNYFRTKTFELSGVLAIKLDEHFPPDLMERVYEKIKKYFEIEEQIDTTDLPEDDPLLDAIINQLDKTRIQIRTEVELIFAEYLERDIFAIVDETNRKKRRKLHRQIKKNNKVIDRLTKSSVKHFHKKHLTAPWAVPKSILSTAFEGYAYGSEKGQVKFLSDHNHIIPLYDYGISTYDFDMDKIKPLVELAQAKAEEKVKEFFK